MLREKTDVEAPDQEVGIATNLARGAQRDEIGADVKEALVDAQDPMKGTRKHIVNEAEVGPRHRRMLKTLADGKMTCTLTIQHQGVATG